MSNHSRFAAPWHALDHSRFTRVISASTVLALAALAMTACQATPTRAAPTTTLTVILATATGNEPDGHLDTDQRGELTAEALAGGAAVVLALPDAPLVPIPLTPRRSDGEVDHGPTRITRTQQLIQALDASLSSAGSHAATLDLLTPINTVVDLAPAWRTSDNHLIVISSGLSTADPVDLNVIGWQENPRALAHDLQSRHLLNDWSRWHVTFAGLGQSAGPQLALPESAKSQLIGYWLAICAAAHALSCDTDDQPRTAATPAHGRPVATVDVPRITTRPGPRGATQTSVPGELLFALNSATLLPGAAPLLAPLLARTETSHRRVCITGMTDSITGSPSYNRRLSLQRARAVERLFLDSGVPEHQIACVVGAGSTLNPPGADRTDGRRDLHKAAQLRRVVITLLT